MIKFLYAFFLFFTSLTIHAQSFILKNTSAQKVVEEYVKRDASGIFLNNNTKPNDIYVISSYKILPNNHTIFPVEYIIEGKISGSKFLKNKEKKVFNLNIEKISEGHRLSYLDFQFVFTSVILKKFHSKLDEESKMNLQTVLKETQATQKKPSLIKTIIQKKVLWKTLSL